jgi:hypothetical protein
MTRRNAMLRAIRPKPIFSMRSTDGERHYILVVNADDVTCSCPAGEFRVECKHVRQVRSSIARRVREVQRRAS